MNNQGNLDFTNMITAAIRSKYPNTPFDEIALTEHLGHKMLRNVVKGIRVPSDTVVVKKISKSFDLDYAELYYAYLKQGFPEIIEWINSFDVSTCMFKDLIKFYRLIYGYSRDEMDIMVGLNSRGNSIRYETGNRRPTPIMLEKLSENLGIDINILRESLSRQKISDGYNKYKYGDTTSSKLHKDIPYVINKDSNLYDVIKQRLVEYDISHVLFSRVAGVSLNVVCVNRDYGCGFQITRISRIAALLNLDVESLIDSYRSTVSFNYLNTNFGNLMFIVASCLGVSIDYVSKRIINIGTTTVYEYAEGARVPTEKFILTVSQGLGIDSDTLLNMFKVPCNYEYVKSYAYDSVRYVIQNNRHSLKNVNVHMVKFLFD